MPSSTLLVEPGVACVQQADQISMRIQASVDGAPEKAAPLLGKTFGGAGRQDGMRGQAATNPNQHAAAL